VTSSPASKAHIVLLMTSMHRGTPRCRWRVDGLFGGGLCPTLYYYVRKRKTPSGGGGGGGGGGVCVCVCVCV
jgi:hypothetical protein